MEPLSYHKNGDGPRPLAHVDYPTGIADQRPLPDSGFGELWDVIILPQEIKDHLLGQAVFNFSARPKVNRAILPLHGILLLYGPPGTGKTSLAKGLAHRTAEVCQGQFQFIEVDPHGLASSHLGRSQRAVGELFQDTLVEMSSGKPTIVLLDEVESLVVDRASLSLEANPIDVHRATDAALAQLDRLAERHPHILFVATSNFPKAIDRAFTSRADSLVEVPLPGPEARLSILRSTLTGMGCIFAKLSGLARDSDLAQVAQIADGLDGRRVRKLVGTACTLRKETSLDPNLLTLQDLLRAVHLATAERTRHTEVAP